MRTSFANGSKESCEPIQAQAFPGHGQLKPERLEIEKLRREVAKLKAERDILEIGRSRLREGRDMRFAFIAKHRSVRPLSSLLRNDCRQGVGVAVRSAGLSRDLASMLGSSGSPSQRSRDDEEIGAKVRASFIGSARTYGAGHIWRDVLAEGSDCGLHRIERLMRALAMRARPRRRGLPKDDGQALNNRAQYARP